MLGSLIIYGKYIFVRKMCIYTCVMIITRINVLTTRGPVQWRGQLVMHHVSAYPHLLFYGLCIVVRTR